ncbi:FAD-linked oxidoreductase [Coleophoma crateriformis]|uniref:Proline dehydrogenase n=1 Tax=Coleophoma crateriformis TaxID=565419 RepID=A0A3D8RJ86_9HELO|nr:FAD-linked oxidoreductase [Coleophoma crateriformis]
MRLPTSNLIRSLFLGALFKSPVLFNIGLAFLKKVASSESPMLNPDKNILLRAIVRPIVYDQFCAGTNRVEVQRTVSDMKEMGFSGVILCYGKELVVDKNTPDSTSQSLQDQSKTQIDNWRDGNLETLRMIGAGDYLGIKVTGAGPAITRALSKGEDPPQELSLALDSICQQAAAQKTRLWIDAEQQALQPTIDNWTIDLMRRHNHNGEALVSNTLQAYLKSSRVSLARQLRLAQSENWSLGIKLVRGAYIGSDPRDRIHDTKEETDACYNGIAKDVLSRSFPGFTKEDFPAVHIFLADHNSESIRMAANLASDLALSGDLKNAPCFGLLQGMADDISCELLSVGENAKDIKAKTKEEVDAQKMAAPQVYKCLTWGTVQECMQYLVRRAVENQGATGRMGEGVAGIKSELRRRIRRGT